MWIEAGDNEEAVLMEMPTAVTWTDCRKQKAQKVLTFH